MENKKKSAFASWFEFYVTAERGIKILAWFSMVLAGLVVVSRIVTTLPYLAEYSYGEQGHIWLSQVSFVAMAVSGYGLLKHKKWGWVLAIFTEINSLICTAFPPYDGYEPFNLATYAIGTAIFAIPILVFLYSKRVQELFAIEKWVVPTLGCVGASLVYAVLDSFLLGGFG